MTKAGDEQPDHPVPLEVGVSPAFYAGHMTVGESTVNGMRSERSLASLLLVQRLAEASASPLTASQYWPLVERAAGLERLLGKPAAVLTAEFGLEAALAEQVAGRLEGAPELADQLDQLDQAGVRALTFVDDGYPRVLVERLKNAPPILFVAGDPALLTTPMLGIVGSRNVDADGAEVARTAARAAVHHGYGVASGGAKGVDQLSMRAALEAEGTVVGVLADSLLRALREPETRRAIANGQVCFCTPFNPSAGFSVANAMGRNKVVYALSAATLVVASEENSGGTWAGAKEAITGRITPVLSWVGPGSGPGNAALVVRGAVELSDLDALFPLPPAVMSLDADSAEEQLILEAMYEKRVPRVRLPDGTVSIPADSLHLVDVYAEGPRR